MRAGPGASKASAPRAFSRESPWPVRPGPGDRALGFEREPSLDQAKGWEATERAGARRALRSGQSDGAETVRGRIGQPLGRYRQQKKRPDRLEEDGALALEP